MFLLYHADFPPPKEPEPIDVVQRCMEDSSKSLRESLKDISNLYYMRPQNLLLFEVGCTLVDIPKVAHAILTERKTSFIDRRTYMSILLNLLFTREKPDSWRWIVQVADGKTVTLRMYDGLVVRGTNKNHHVLLPSVLAGVDMTERIKRGSIEGTHAS